MTALQNEWAALWNINNAPAAISREKFSVLGLGPGGIGHTLLMKLRGYVPTTSARGRR